MPLEFNPPESSMTSPARNPALSSDRDAPSQPVEDPTADERGTILDRWGISPAELTTLVNENPSLRGIMLGYVVEHKFHQLIEKHPHISESRKYDDHDRARKSDRVLVYKGEE